MEKISSQNKVCTYCERPALPDTYPPVCEEHLHSKTASEDGSTLKELDTADYNV